MLSSTHHQGPSELRSGTPVVVRNRFDGGWADGFEIADDGTGDGTTFRVRRRCDNAVLPARFGPDDLRTAPPSNAAGWTSSVPPVPEP